VLEKCWDTISQRFFLIQIWYVGLCHVICHILVWQDHAHDTNDIYIVPWLYQWCTSFNYIHSLNWTVLHYQIAVTALITSKLRQGRYTTILQPVEGVNSRNGWWLQWPCPEARAFKKPPRFPLVKYTIENSKRNLTGELNHLDPFTNDRLMIVFTIRSHLVNSLICIYGHKHDIHSRLCGCLHVDKL